MNFAVSVKRVMWLLVTVVLILTGLSIAGQLYKYFLASSNPNLFGYVRLFYLGEEQSIPTWYSSFALLLCSVLLAVIFLANRSAGGRYTRHWGILSIIFLYLSVDEGSSVHEKMGRIVKVVFRALDIQPGGFLSSGWVVPAALLVLVFVLAYLRFFMDLPARQKLLFFAAGAVYVGGALLLEVVAASYVSFFGGTQNMTGALNFGRTMIATTEELFEMSGVLIFVYALLTYIRSHVREITVRVNGKA
jgi:hypothetical protein